MRKYFYIGILLFAAAISVSGTVSAKDDSISNEVQLMRQDRQIKMPYLDKGIIRSEINSQKIKDRKNFLAAGSKDLEMLIERAIAAYTPARAARERIALSRRRILVALRMLLPEGSLELNDKSGDLSDQDFNSLNYRFSFRQPIFRGGVLWNTLLQEKAGLEGAEKEYAAALQDVINDVSAAYIEYSRAKAVIDSQEKVISEMQHFTEISEKKFQQDIISEIEHLNVQSLHSQIRYDYETSKQELELAKLELQKLLGLEIDDDLEVSPLYQVEALLTKQTGDQASADAAATADASANTNESPETADKAIDDELADLASEPAGEPAQRDEGYDLGETHVLPELTDLVDMAYTNRPELQVEAAKLESARLEERIRMGKLLPQADAVLEFGKLGEAFNEDDLTPSMEREFRFMLEFNWNIGGSKVGYTHDTNQLAPTVSQFLGRTGSNVQTDTFRVGFFDSLKDYADTKEAEVLRLDQVTLLEKTEKEVVQDVKKSYFDYQKARIQVKSSLQRVDYRQRLVLLSKHKLDKNEIQISEYLQSEIDLLQELMTLHKAIADYYTAKARMNHAIGIRNFLPLGEANGRDSAA
jgi:outer membrane protein TolC